MERQYIGARYVPKFADPINWNDQTAYEALTIVTYMGASYTSKKAVPAGVKPTDSNYWVMTGNYNAQMEEYRQQVAQYKQTTENYAKNFQLFLSGLTEQLNGKSIVVYGDSISDDGTSPSNVFQPCWVDRLREALPDSHIVNKAVAGYYISGETASIVNLIRNDSFPYDIIIIFGGVNDFRHSRPLGSFAASNTDVTTFNGALNLIGSTLNAKATDKKVIFISPLKEKYYAAYPEEHDPNKPLSVYRGCIKRACDFYGFSYIEGYNAPMLNPFSEAKVKLYQPDGLHINNVYAPILANYIAAKIAFESYDDVARTITRTGCTFFNETVSVTYAYADICSDGTVELTMSGTMATDGTNQLIGVLPDYLVPAVSFSSAISVQVNAEAMPGIVTISGDTGNILLKTTESASATVVIHVRYNLKHVAGYNTSSV